MATIHLKFIGFNTIKFLQSENIFELTEALRYHKQLSTSLIAVGDIIIGKSFDKLVKARDVKVSTKQWRDRSQTQQYGGSGTGYFLWYLNIFPSTNVREIYDKWFNADAILQPGPSQYNDAVLSV